MDLAERFHTQSGHPFTDKHGKEYQLALLPPLSESEIVALERSLPCPIPAEIRALLRMTRGIENGPLEFDIGGAQEGGFGLEEVFPSGWPIAHDGCGNFWVVDLLPESKVWGPIYFACHDAPVIVYQCAGLGEFLDAFVEMAQPPHKGPLNFVQNEATQRIWENEPNTIQRPVALAGPDPELNAFAQSLDDSWLLVDLRNPKTGDGFAWGRAAAPSDIKRWKTLPIFAYRRKKSIWQRLFGK